MLTIPFLIYKLLGVLSLSVYWVVLLLIADILIFRLLAKVADDFYTEGLNDGRLEATDIHSIDSAEKLIEVLTRDDAK